MSMNKTSSATQTLRQLGKKFLDAVLDELKVEKRLFEKRRYKAFHDSHREEYTREIAILARRHQVLMNKRRTALKNLRTSLGI